MKPAKIIIDGNAEEIPFVDDKDYSPNTRTARVRSNVEQLPFQFGLQDPIVARRNMNVSFTIECYENGFKCWEKKFISEFDLYRYDSDEELKERILKDIKECREFSMFASSARVQYTDGPWIETVEIIDEAGVLKWLTDPKQLAAAIFQIPTTFTATPTWKENEEKIH